MDLEQMLVEVREVLPAPPEAVYALLSDPERTAGLAGETVRVAWDGPERAAGASFRGYNEREGRAWDVPCRVVEADPPRRFAWTVGAPDAPSARWSYDLAPDDGGTLVVQRFQHGPGFSFVRASCEQRPERAPDVVAGRAAELERNMRAVLRAAGQALVSGGAAG